MGGKRRKTLLAAKKREESKPSTENKCRKIEESSSNPMEGSTRVEPLQAIQREEIMIIDKA